MVGNVLLVAYKQRSEFNLCRTRLRKSLVREAKSINHEAPITVAYNSKLVGVCIVNCIQLERAICYLQVQANEMSARMSGNSGNWDLI